MIKGEAFDFKGVRTGFEKKTANILSLVKKKFMYSTTGDKTFTQ